MPDIQLRFHRDMLVLSSPIAPVLARQGFELDGDVEYATLMEPEAVEDALFAFLSRIGSKIPSNRPSLDEIVHGSM